MLRKVSLVAVPLTERIGSVAALATLNVMQETESWKVVTKLGDLVKENWESIANQNKKFD